MVRKIKPIKIMVRNVKYMVRNVKYMVRKFMVRIIYVPGRPRF